MGRVVSADDFFMKDGVYRHVIAKLAEAHAACFLGFFQGVQEGATKVAIMSGVPGSGKSHHAKRLASEGWLVVDNTSTEAFEISPYILCAQAFGIKVIKIFRVNCDPAKAFGRQTHGVPENVHKRLAEAFNQRSVMPWWSVEEIQN